MSGALARARGVLARPGGWIDVAGPGGGYAVRMAADRRVRAVTTLDEAAFQSLIQAPGLRTRPGGGWEARATPPPGQEATIGAPGRIEGTRSVILEDGRIVSRRANLGESPIAWLARRTDATGKPWLSPAEIAAAERLRMDAEIAQSGPSLTMRWDALPRTGGAGSSARIEPDDRAMAAGRRMARALDACGAARGIVDHICVRGRSIQLAEQDFGLRRRTGKLVLRQGLSALARHYGIG